LANWYYAYDIVVVWAASGVDSVHSVEVWVVLGDGSAHFDAVDAVADYYWEVLSVGSAHFAAEVLALDSVRFVQAVSSVPVRAESAQYRAYSYGILLPYSFSLTSSLHHMKRQAKKYYQKENSTAIAMLLCRFLLLVRMYDRENTVEISSDRILRNC
jgi:hypothetical protein